MAKDAKMRAQRAPQVSDERMKWLEWDEYLTLVQNLKSECGSARRKQAERCSPVRSAPA